MTTWVESSVGRIQSEGSSADKEEQVFITVIRLASWCMQRPDNSAANLICSWNKQPVNSMNRMGESECWGRVHLRRAVQRDRSERGDAW